MRKIFLFATLLLIVSSCKKSNDTSQKTDDQGTFEVKINNDWLTPCIPAPNNIGPISTNILYYTPTDYFLSVSEKDDCNTSYYIHGRSVSIFFDSVQIEVNRTYKLGNNGRGQIRCNYQSAQHFVSDLNLPGTITILKYDPLVKIISASFEGTLRETTTGETIVLTHGKFDLKY